MLGQIIRQFQKFSRENWWIYVFLFFCLIFIYFTQTGNIYKILIVFWVYISAELCMMNMITLIEESDYRLSSIFQLLWNSILTLLFLYHYYDSWQLQYILWSVGFLLWSFKTISKYHWGIPLSYINGLTIMVLNIVIFFWVYVIYLDPTLQILFQIIGWTLFSSCLVMDETHKTRRYFMWFFGLLSMIVWSTIGIYGEFLFWNIYGVTLAYLLFPIAVFSVYAKNLKNYL